MTKLTRLIEACKPFVDMDRISSTRKSQTMIRGQMVPCETTGCGDHPEAEYYTVYPTREEMDELRSALRDAQEADGQGNAG